MKITEILTDQTITNQFDFSGSCPNDQGISTSFDIFSTSFFVSEIIHKYFNRVAFVDLDNAFNDFVAVFNSWKTTRGPMYARMMYGYSLGYNPIENYSSVEVMDRTDVLTRTTATERTYSNDVVERSYVDDTITHAVDQNDPDTNERYYDPQNPDTIEISHENDKTITTYNDVTDTHEHDKYGVNSSNAVHQSVDTDTKSGDFDVEQSGKQFEKHSGGYKDIHTGTSTDTHSGGFTDTHSGGYTDSNSGDDTTDIDYTLTKSGNIGVMTASQMLQSLYDGLFQDVQDRAIKEFLDKYTFYDGEVEIW